MDALERLCEQLKAENELMDALERLCEQLKAENEELRSLVLDMFMTFCYFREEPMSYKEELRHEVRFWKKLDKLGIEVKS